MMVATKVSPYKTGSPRFGRKSSPHDYSCKSSTLSPEELERYRNGEHGGKKMEDVLTKERYIQFKNEGKSDKDIQKMYRMKSAGMSNFKKKNGLLGKFKTHSIRTETKEKIPVQKNEEETPLNNRQEQVNEQSTDMTLEKHAENTMVDHSVEVIELESRIIQLEKELNEAEQKLIEQEKQHSKEIGELQTQVREYELASVEQFKSNTKYYRQAQIYGQLLKESLTRTKLNGYELHPYQEALLEALPD